MSRGLRQTPRRPGDAIALWRRVAEPLYRLGLAGSARGAGEVRLSRARVVSVGGLEAGGVGKTPCVLWWAARLCRERAVAIVCRPYGDRDGDRSDEVQLLRERAPAGVRVVVHDDKSQAAREAERLGAEVVVVDDGFAHRRLHRDLDLLLLDAAHPFANGRLLPAGPLREPPESVTRADAVVLTRADRVSPSALATTEQRVRAAGFGGTILAARHRVLGVRVAGQIDAIDGLRVYCVSGLGRPGELAEAARLAGADVVGSLDLADHALPTREEWEVARQAAQAAGGRLLVSAKDEARLPVPWRSDAAVLEMEWEWLEGDEAASQLAADVLARP